MKSCEDDFSFGSFLVARVDDVGGVGSGLLSGSVDR